MSIERAQWGCGEQAMVNTHTHTNTHTISRDTQGGWSPAKGLDAILTHVGLTLPLIKLMDYEHREDEVGVGGAGNGKHILTRIHTHSPSLYTGWRQDCVRSLLETIYTLSITRDTVCVCVCHCLLPSPPLRPLDVRNPLK